MLIAMCSISGSLASDQEKYYLVPVENNTRSTNVVDYFVIIDTEECADLKIMSLKRTLGKKFKPAEHAINLFDKAGNKLTLSNPETKFTALNLRLWSENRIQQERATDTIHFHTIKKIDNNDNWRLELDPLAPTDPPTGYSPWKGVAIIFTAGGVLSLVYVVYNKYKKRKKK